MISVNNAITEKPNMNFTDDHGNSIDDFSGQISALETQTNPLVSAEVSASTELNPYDVATEMKPYYDEADDWEYR